MAIDMMDVGAEAHKLQRALAAVSFLASDVLEEMSRPDTVHRMEGLCALLELIERKAAQVVRLTDQGAADEPDAQRAAA